MAVHDSEWLNMVKMAAHDLKRLEIAVIWLKWLEIAVNCNKFMKMAHIS